MKYVSKLTMYFGLVIVCRPNTKKDGRVIDLMLRFMKLGSVQETLMENDRESAVKIKDILERYVERK